MSDVERLRVSGGERDRELLQRATAEPVVVPDQLRLLVAQRLATRLARPPRRRLALAVGGVLLAGGAALAGTLLRHHPSPPPAPLPATRPAAVTRPSPLPPLPHPPPAARTRHEPPHQHASRAPLPHPLQTPDLSFERFRTGAPAEESGDDPAAPPPPPRLLIAREGRAPTALVLAGDQVVGSIRGTAVRLTLTPAQILGRLGERNVWLWLHGSQAEGEIGGVPVRFEVLETAGGHLLREGYSVRKSLPAQSTRVELGAGTLTWFPGCDAPLDQGDAGTYQGRCTAGDQARVVIPPGWQRLPVLSRLILLSVFLTERDPSFAPLFGAVSR
jgi:hypothetical protein